MVTAIHLWENTCMTHDAEEFRREIVEIIDKQVLLAPPSYQDLNHVAQLNPSDIAVLIHELNGACIQRHRNHLLKKRNCTQQELLFLAGKYQFAPDVVSEAIHKSVNTDVKLKWHGSLIHIEHKKIGEIISSLTIVHALHFPESATIDVYIPKREEILKADVYITVSDPNMGRLLTIPIQHKYNYQFKRSEGIITPNPSVEILDSSLPEKAKSTYAGCLLILKHMGFGILNSEILLAQEKDAVNIIHMAYLHEILSNGGTVVNEQGGIEDLSLHKNKQNILVSHKKLIGVIGFDY